MTLEEARQRLNKKGTSRYFTLFWNEPHGPIPEALYRYSLWLDDAYTRMLGPPFRRVPPQASRIPVYILNPRKVFPAFSGPFSDVDKSGPLLVLPDEIDYTRVEDRAMAGVVREVTRIFNGFVRDPRDPGSGSWAWFDAAFADKVAELTRPPETQAEPTHAVPYRTFEEAAAGEYGKAFIDRLSTRIGLAGLNRLWMEGARDPGVTPMELLEREYLVSLNYLLPAFHQDLYLSHFQRSVESDEEDETEFLKILPSGSMIREDALDHGTGRWYRLRFDRDLKSLEIALEPRAASSCIVGQVAVVNDAGEYQSVRRLEEQLTGNLSARLSDVDSEMHVTLIVSNCGHRGVHEQHAAHDDRQFYSLHIRGVTSAA